MGARIGIALAALLAALGQARATEPCLAPEKAWFLEEVARPSDLVVFGVVEDYSGRFSRWLGREWTVVRVIETLKGEAPARGSVTIRGWRASDPPRYVQEVGDHLLLWLTVDGAAHRMTNASWQACVPSLWGAWREGTVYDPLKGARAPRANVKALIEEAGAE